MPIKLNQLVLILLVAVALYMGWRHQQTVFDNQGRLVAELEAGSSDTVVFYWKSDIDMPMAVRFREAFDEWRDRTRRVVIDLHSPGGSLWEGRRVIEQINRMKRTHRVDTRVTGYHSCLSMCVPIFLQGQNRTASAASKWMFHEPGVFDHLTGEKVNIPEGELKALARRFFELYYVNSDMNPTWRRALEREWQGKDVWRSGQQLVDEGSNIIHSLL